MVTWSESDTPFLGDRVRITISDDNPQAQALADQIRASVSRATEAPLQESDGIAPVSILTSPDIQLVHPDTALQLPKTPDRVEAPDGYMGFLSLVQGATGIREWNPISHRLLVSDVSANAYLLVPEYDNLKPLVLYGIDPKIRVRMTQTEQMKQDFEAVKQLEELLEQNGWQMVRGFSYFQKQPRKMGEKEQSEQYYGTLLLVKHSDMLWELPPRETPYSLDFPKLLERGEETLPTDAIPFMQTQSYYDVQFYARVPEDKDPGISWVSENALPSDFMVFRGNFDGVWGDWVVRRLTFPGEDYPASIEGYLLKRFGATLDIKHRRIIAPADAIPHIKGRSDEFNRRHIDRIEDAIGLARLEVMTQEEATVVDGARNRRSKDGKTTSHAHGGEARDNAREKKATPLVRIYRSVNDEQRAQWDKKGYAIFQGNGIFWIVKKTPEAIAQYLNERFEARLELESGSIVISGDKTVSIKILYGKEHAHINALAVMLEKELAGRSLRIVKTFRE